MRSASDADQCDVTTRSTRENSKRKSAGCAGRLATGSIPSFALRLRYTVRVKSASIPSVRVDPAFRAEVESVLGQGETLSEFVEASIRAGVHHRRAQAEFIARGLRSGEEAKRNGHYVDADVVLDRLQHKLDVARGKTQRSSTVVKR